MLAGRPIYLVGPEVLPETLMQGQEVADHLPLARMVALAPTRVVTRPVLQVVPGRPLAELAEGLPSLPLLAARQVLVAGAV